MTETTEQEIYRRLCRAGAAIGTINGNNTHSGNLSLRDPQNRDRFYITASGSMCGALVPRDIVPLSFSGVSWGDGRASTESTIHRKVLAITGANAVIHAHFFYTTVISFDTAEKELFLNYSGTDDKGRDDFVFTPVDLPGLKATGGVKIGSYLQPVGSAEMEERIPRYLKADRLTIVRGHGSFVRASSPEEALHLMTVLETSAGIAVHLRRRGAALEPLRRQLLRFSETAAIGMHSFADTDFSRCDVTDQTVLADFRERLIYNYTHSLGGFAAGSMSQKVSPDHMIYCPMSACPEGFNAPLCRLPLKPEPGDTVDEGMHKLIYAHTHQNTCMITVSPLAVAEAGAVLAETRGPDAVIDPDRRLSYTPEDHPVIKPIDAEAIYLNPRVGLAALSCVYDRTPENPVLNMLRWYKGCCAVAGYGVISTGETTLEQAAHNAASAERIARFRMEVYLNSKTAAGPPLTLFEP